ncbi:MAG: hypothetical protein COB08_015880 [Rhodobacteraceae bacterium]|nr:hypothetical protein [Paracoccaceae bacterium]
MSRSRSPKKTDDEAGFPIRIRVLVPEAGFGIHLDEMYDWLKRRTENDFAINADSLPGTDAMSIYLRDWGIGKEFVERFGLAFSTKR